jgi:hypothetical protein
MANFEYFRWYAYRSKQDKVGTKASSHKPQYGIYFFPLWEEPRTSIPSVHGLYIGDMFPERHFESYALDAWDTQFVLWTGPTDILWQKIAGSRGLHGVIINTFETDLFTNK